jgi:hypothetical protein
VEGTKRVDHETGLTGWILAVICFIGSLLSSVIAMFYKKQSDSWDRREAELKAEIATNKASFDAKLAVIDKRSEDCEKHRNALAIAHAVLQSEHKILEQRVSDVEVNKKNRDSVGYSG